ncbi:MAG: CPBP family intramembrane glutamic endopeptidase [Chloroflexota bacterium]
MNNAERRKTIWRIVIFSILVTAMAWLSPLLGGSPSSPGPGFILWGAAPLSVSLLMRFATRDWDDLGIRPAIGSNVQWYGMSIVSIPILLVLTLLIGVLTSISSMSEFLMGKYLQTALTALPFFFIFAIFEEIGWRGYLAPKLDSLGVNRFMASAIVAIVWATWHMPYIRELTWVYSSEDLAAFVPRFYLVCFAFSILYGEIRTITGSVWPAVLMHAVANSFGHPLAAEYVTYAAGTDYLGSISNGLIVIALVGFLGIAINRWRWIRPVL